MTGAAWHGQQTEGVECSTLAANQGPWSWRLLIFPPMTDDEWDAYTARVDDTFDPVLFRFDVDAARRLVREVKPGAAVVLDRMREPTP